MYDPDQLVIAWAEARTTRDRIARHLPDGSAQDTPELTLLAHRLNDAFVHRSRAVLDMRLALNQHHDSRIILDVVPERRG